MTNINISFTKKQFLELIKLVSLWELVINWHRLPDDWDKESQKLEEYIVDIAVKNNIKDYLYYFEWSKAYDISQEKEMEFFELLFESQEDYFDEEIVWILARNELNNRYSEKELDEMDIEKREKLFFDLLDQVEKEISENWYENIKINLNKKNPLFL